MKQELRPKNILAIESAVGDGSLAIVQNGVTSITHAGDGASRAERIVPLIHDSLNGAGLTIRDLDLIAVSVGPGSYSGIRIGMSTALGLRDALEIPCVGVPVLNAMAHASDDPGTVICSVPVGKHDAAWQPFGPRSATGRREVLLDPQICVVSELLSEITPRDHSTLYAYRSLFERLLTEVPEQVQIRDAGTALAKLIGLFAAERKSPQDSMTPIYIRNREPAVRAV